MSAEQACRITTFYSYKGGTGRTMALANVAWILAATGRRVLTIDWDLEAPGLHRYLAPFLTDPECQQTDGLLDWVYEYLVALTQPGTNLPANWADDYAEISGFAASAQWQFPGNGCLHFISAGRQDAGYAERVNKLDWFRFYTEHGGKAFIESAFRQAREFYDHILIDSRTGVADTSGICTAQLPDQLVAMYTLNNQSIDGCSEVAKHAQAARSADPRGLQVLPVATRVEFAEDDRLKKRQRLARARCEQFVPARERSAYFANLQLPYVPYYAYEEMLATIREQPDGGHPLLRGFLALASKVAGQEIKGLPEISPAKREAALANYAATRAVSSTEPDDPSAPALAPAANVEEHNRWEVFISYTLDLTQQAEALHRHLAARVNAFIASRSVPAGANVDVCVNKAQEQVTAHVFLIGTKPLLAAGWYDREMKASLARRDATGSPRIIPVLVDGAKVDAAGYRRLAEFQAISVNSGGERAAAQAILTALGIKDERADDVRERAVAAETRLEELGVKSRRNQVWLVAALLASAGLTAGGILQHRQATSDEASLLEARTDLDHKQAELKKSQQDLLAKQQDLVRLSAQGRLQELTASTGQLSAYVAFVANQVQQTTTANDFTEVIPLLDDASARAHAQLSVVDALATDITTSQLEDDKLTKDLDAQRDALNKVVEVIQKIAQDIAAKPSKANDPLADARKLWQEGYALSAQGQAEPARLKYVEALKRKSNYAPAINSLGVLHYSAGRFQAADEQFQKAIAADPKYVAGYTNHALALIALGRPAAEARAAAEDALKRRPGYAPALNILSKLDAKVAPPASPLKTQTNQTKQ